LADKLRLSEQQQQRGGLNNVAHLLVMGSTTLEREERDREREREREREMLERGERREERERRVRRKRREKREVEK